VLPTSPFNAPVPSFVSLLYGVPTQVGLPTKLTFTITPTTDIEYFVIKLPPFFLNDDYSLFNTSCSTALKIDMFYRSDLIRIYPIGIHLANTKIVYEIINFPSPQYSFSYQNWDFII
jgi:hypothetical protein